MDKHSDENLGLTPKVVSGESEEVMLSDPQSGEDSSPGELRDDDYGARDDDAAEEYAKRTTTETEHEGNIIDEGVAFATTVPPSQIMDVQSNVVPAPTETMPLYSSGGEPGGNDSKRNSEDGYQELSVGHSSLRADLNSDVEELDEGLLDANAQQGSQQDILLAPDEALLQANPDDTGSVRILEDSDPDDLDTSSAEGSMSLNFENSQQAPSSPVMFAGGNDQDEEAEPESPTLTLSPAIKERGLDPSAFANIGNAADAGRELESIKQTMETMEPDTDVGQSTSAQPSTEPKELEIPQSETRQEAVSEEETRASGSRDQGGLRRGGLPALPPRRGMGSAGLVPRASSGSTSAQPRPPTTGGQPQTSQTQTRSLPMPVGIGDGGLPPPRTQQPQTGQPQQPQQRGPAVHAVPVDVQPAQRNATTGNGGEGSSEVEPPEVVEARRKLLDIRLTVLRIASRLGLKPLDFAITDFMGKIDRGEQLRFRGPGLIRPQLDSLFTQAVQQDERTGPNSNLELTVTAIVLGPSGTGKSAVIRNLLHPGQGLAPEFPSESTDKITVQTGRVYGVNFKLIDTPGLSVAASALRKNMKILRDVDRAIKKHKPDAVIYVDRMDVFRRELSDIPLLRLVNEMLPELLYNCIALLTHASAPAPDAGHGIDMPYTEYQRLRLDLCTQIITHAISDMRWAGRPLGFENHPNCSVNREGIPVLPSGQTFKRQAIFHLICSHMSVQMEKVCKTKQLRQRTLDHMMFMMQPRKQLQLSALVSQLLAPKAPKKFPDEERELLTRREIRKLSSEAERLEEENKRRDYTRLRKVEILQEEAHPSQVPIVGANMELSPSFDHEVNQHRYNATDFVYGWSVRPIMSSQDNIYEHDDGIEMFQVARDGVLRTPGKCVDGMPASMIVQAGKGKNFGNIQMDAGVSCYATRNLVGSTNIVVHPAGQDGEVVYTPTVDLRVKTGDKYKTTVGGMACRLAENGWPNKGQLGLGAKLENKVKVKDGVKLTAACGAMTVKPSSSQARDVAYGGNVEMKLAGGKGEYDPNFLFSGGISHQKRGAFKRTGLSGQISGEQAISPETMINARLQLSAGGSGTSSLRMITHDKPQTGWLMAVPIVIKAVKRLLGHGDEFV